MITLEDYFGPRLNHPEATEEMKANARMLLSRVNALLAQAAREGGYTRPINPKTKSAISGWSGDGGFRLRLSATGSPTSAHKRALGIDIFDPDGELDEYLNDHDNADGSDNDVLRTHHLYREHPDDTPTWCHLQTVPPRSGRRTFKP